MEKIKKGDQVAVVCTVIEEDCGPYPNMHGVMPVTDDNVEFVACQQAIMGHVGWSRDNGYSIVNKPAERRHRIVEYVPGYAGMNSPIYKEANEKDWIVLSVVTKKALIGQSNDIGIYPGFLAEDRTFLIKDADWILNDPELMSWLSVGRVLMHKPVVNLAYEIHARLVLMCQPREYSLTMYRLFEIQKWKQYKGGVIGVGEFAEVVKDNKLTANKMGPGVDVIMYDEASNIPDSVLISSKAMEGDKFMTISKESEQATGMTHRSITMAEEEYPPGSKPTEQKLTKKDSDDDNNDDNSRLEGR